MILGIIIILLVVFVSGCTNLQSETGPKLIFNKTYNSSSMDDKFNVTIPEGTKEVRIDYNLTSVGIISTFTVFIYNETGNNTKDDYKWVFFENEGINRNGSINFSTVNKGKILTIKVLGCTGSVKIYAINSTTKS